ncbi:isoaspartyl peptidase/L-asparaginase family protein [Salinarimonas ramus]|uniref:Isoaspartyl peptidase n=1 Tax=Salinarimonas ramus TaxID=690164 RepID=A0A917V648_9HYPH|nr:isoaspartyl peptidase/L-asparaginase [Salinarimonas ramus]GGK42223.1 isoaspartyl peptidase/L-asparaginase [Salinarimonas ramus]
MSDTRFTIAVHGGAGTIDRALMTPERDAATRAGLARALEAGGAILADGGSAVDAVAAAVCALEDEPLFNAGRGAVFTSAGRQEMDAAIMDGRDRACGAVTAICGPRNPILAAKAVMERSPHVLLAGEGALAFCREHAIAFEDDAYFFTQSRWQALQDTLARRRAGRDENDGDEARRHGTVGAVARDRHGHIAAATSTGGMTAKAPGRIGDTPLFGAGTFADDATCAMSGTGHGEVFVRWCAGHELHARMLYAEQSLAQAAEGVVMEALLPNDGSGGLIAVDAAGNVALPFNCSGMYRGVMGADRIARVAIYREDLAEESRR